jgi:hypothetical protein
MSQHDEWTFWRSSVVAVSFQKAIQKTSTLVILRENGDTELLSIILLWFVDGCFARKVAQSDYVCVDWHCSALSPA